MREKPASRTSKIKCPRQRSRPHRKGKGGRLSVGAATRSKDEIAGAIRSFTSAQWARLRKVAQSYSYALDAEDLLQEAFSRALGDNERHCPGDVDVVRFLAQVMRSIANGEYERAKRRPTFVALANHGGQQENALDPPDPAIGVDDWLVREQQAARQCREILALFDDDPVARDILEGRVAELTADELRELTGLDATAYATKLRLIRRKINKAFTKGWKP
jgi:DNA-directed RNA polymerase specialized sigma24 family protein